MKLTDFALIFIGVTLPIIIIVYVNVSFTIKAEEQEMYYKKVISTSLNDASDQMKEVENSDSEIDYGYSGVSNNKISVNSQVAVDTFLNSMYNNFGIKGNKDAENYLQYFIPAIAVIDYNGVQVSSIESFEDDSLDGQKVVRHSLKPKKYYTYEYYIYYDSTNGYRATFSEKRDDAKESSLQSYHLIEFTMDDYVTHRGYEVINGRKEEIEVSGFYLTDTKNNYKLFSNTQPNVQSKKDCLKDTIKKLQEVRKSVIINAIESEMQFATNNNNIYASNAGIKYNFVFPTLEEGEMESQIKNVGIMALVQGISIGNRYLNTRAYSTSKLTEITRYYLTIPKTDDIANKNSKYIMNLYHKDVNCPEYRVSTHNNITPGYLFTKQQAASVRAVYKTGNTYITLEGFYPCPICNP